MLPSRRGAAAEAPLRAAGLAPEHLWHQRQTPPVYIDCDSSPSRCQNSNNAPAPALAATTAMSIPPQLIRVKRKRIEESPVTFLRMYFPFVHAQPLNSDPEFAQDSKRHRTGSNWAYQRRNSTASRPPVADNKTTQPVIHVSEPPQHASPAKERASSAKAVAEQPPSAPLEPRRFHVSKRMLAQSASKKSNNAGVSKKDRYSPALFVEAIRKKKIPKTRRSLAPGALLPQAEGEDKQVKPAAQDEIATVEQKQFKKPGLANRSKATQQETVARAPLPEYRHDNLDKRAADMDQWVLNELGTKLHTLERQEKTAKFRPKAPAQRFQERHPDLAVPSSSTDTSMTDVSDDEGDEDDEEWIIEEYVRIPAHSMAQDISPSDVGILELNDEEESILFFGSAVDEDDELAEDEEDENGKPFLCATQFQLRPNLS